MSDPRIRQIEWAPLEGQRPRHAGANARLGNHGQTVRVPVARLTADDGTVGFGISRVTREQAGPLLGGRLADAFHPDRGVTEAWLPLEYPVWDLAARQAGIPVYALAATVVGAPPPAAPFRVPCYDTSLYFDDLHLSAHDAAAALIAAEARDGYERGHRAFKIKVGRGAKHLPLEEGMRRDVAVVRAVREAVGPEPTLMLDANNGLNLNLAQRLLAETAECRVFWLEEAFHEDGVLYRDLREWLDQRHLDVLIADGEGAASPSLLDWARQRLVAVVQYDYLGHGFTRWLATGRQLDGWAVCTAPHHYGTLYGNYASGHLAGAIRGFTYVEWDEATTPALAAPGYAIHEGRVTIPEAPGFGLVLDETAFSRAVAEDGFRLSL